MKTACQILLLALLTTALLKMLYQDINGREAQPPLGFKGAVISLAVVAALFFVYWKAGSFSTLFGGEP